MNVPNRENRMSALISGPTNYVTNFTHDIDCGWMALPPTAPTRIQACSHSSKLMEILLDLDICVFLVYGVVGIYSSNSLRVPALRHRFLSADVTT